MRLKNRNTSIYWFILANTFLVLYLFSFSHSPIFFVILTSALLVLLVLALQLNLVWFIYPFVVFLLIFLYNVKDLTWDAVSFELMAFYDFNSSLKGAYWDYAKFPSFIYGFASYYGEIYISLVYGISVLLYMITLADSFRPNRKSDIFVFLFFCLISFGLIRYIFHIAKGDLLSLSFSLLSLKFFLNSIGRKRQVVVELVNIFIFAFLAIASKSSMFVFLLPQLVYSFVLLLRNISISKTYVLFYLLFFGFFSNLAYIQNLVNYGQIFDNQSSADALGKYSLLGQILFSGPSVLLEGITRIKMILVFLILFVIIRVLTSPIRPRTFFSLWFLSSIFFVPYLLLHGWENQENFRLISFPILASLLCVRGK
ncbi:hypothetical protein LFX27_15915 [Leptospira mtsangambouensis]|nr:hypothetical protein [Leptospira mtsangambouensis]